jgi:small-conductance mechanosensitive channel
LPFEDLIESGVSSASDLIETAIGTLTHRSGLQDFYSAHILTYCSGMYTPTSLPNATLPESAIDKNVTDCSATRALFSFDPEQALTNSLTVAGVDLTFGDLPFPQEVQDGFVAVRVGFKAIFVLYVIGVAAAFLALLAGLGAVLKPGRLIALAGMGLAGLAFLAQGIASAVVTALTVRATDAVNKYGDRAGIEANRGDKFLALTWAATALLFVAAVVFLVDVLRPGGRKVRTEKHG